MRPTSCPGPRPCASTWGEPWPAGGTAVGRLVVLVGGTRVVNAAVTLPRNVLVGFSGSTGGLTDRHTVTGVRVGY